jgi:serine/threonine-protein phosphatase 2A activator
MEYVVPIKRIVTKEDLEEFLNSTAYQEYIDYIERLNDSVKNLKIDTDVGVSKVSKTHLHFLSLIPDLDNRMHKQFSIFWKHY